MEPGSDVREASLGLVVAPPGGPGQGAADGVLAAVHLGEQPADLCEGERGQASAGDGLTGIVAAAGAVGAAAPFFAV